MHMDDENGGSEVKTCAAENRVRTWIAWALALVSIGIIGLYSAGSSSHFAVYGWSTNSHHATTAENRLRR